jgi:hypothetical protein
MSAGKLKWIGPDRPERLVRRRCRVTSAIFSGAINITLALVTSLYMSTMSMPSGELSWAAPLPKADRAIWAVSNSTGTESR